MIQVRYLFSTLVNIPLLPVLYLQAKRIRQNVPSLPKANNPTGFFGQGTKTLRLLSIGESTIAGIGVNDHKEGFTGHLAKLLAGANNLRVEWRVMAKSGFTASHVRKILIPKLANQSADLIVIGLGGNDTFKLNPPNKWRKDLQLLIDDLKVIFPEVPIVFINVPPVRSFPAFTALAKFVLGRHIDLLHKVLQEVVSEHEGVWYSDSRIRLKDWLNYWPGKTLSTKDFFSDGVHPSELTYKTWAGEVADFIRERSILE